MNENFNGLNEANSLDNNEMNNQSSLEPTLNSINNTETLNAESESFVQSNNVYENTLNATNSENIVVSEMGAPEVINPISLNETVSVDTNDTTLETQASMNTPEPNPFGVVNNEANNFTMNVGITNNESNMGLNQSEVVSPTQNIETLETNVNTAPAIEPGKKKNNLIMILIIVLIVVLGAVGGFFAYKYIVMSNPVTIIEKSLTKFGKEAETAIKEYNLEIDKILNNKTQNELSFELNEYAASFILQTDYNNKLIGFNVDAKEDGESLVNVNGAVDEEAAYFKLKDSSNSFMYEYDFSELFNTVEGVEEIDPILVNFITYLGDSVKEVFTKEDFTKDKVELDLNGKKVKATKYTLPFNDSTVNPLLDNYKNKLTSDDSLITYLTDFINNNPSSMSKITKADMIESIGTFIDDMKLTSADNEENIELCIFVSGAELLGITFGIDDNNKIEVHFNDLVELNYWVEGQNVLTANFAEDEFKMNIETPEDSIIVDFADGKYKIDIKVDVLNVVVDGTYNITDTSTELTFNTEIMGEKYSGKLAVKENISDDIKINVPSGALDILDENNQAILIEELETMPIYELIEPYMSDDYYSPESPGDPIIDDYYYNDDYYYDDSEWEF